MFEIPAYIQRIHPLLALIFCGANNRNRPFASQTLQTLNQEGVNIFDTPHHGVVSLKFANIGAIYKTAAHEFGIINIGD